VIVHTKHGVENEDIKVVFVEMIIDAYALYEENNPNKFQMMNLECFSVNINEKDMHVLGGQQIDY